MKLLILRHGEALDDIEDCYGGVADFPLTDKGREQARVLARGLNGHGVQAVFSSPLARARETAEIIAGELEPRLDVMVVSDLMERNSYGVLSGVNKARAATIFAHVLRDLKEKPGYSREPLLGAEDFDQFVARVRRAFMQVIDAARQRTHERVVVVSHGTFIRVLLTDVLGVCSTPPDLGGISVVNYRPAEASLDSLAL